MGMLLLNVFGGLAIFIFGMKMMSDGLHKVAGEKMRSILRFFSANRFVAILSGTLVTAVIQSSSASTVMVIGFVNAGLLNLVQSIGIIFGANIGTTITAQLVAFEISWIIMPAIIVGLLLSFITNPAARGWGETVIGFGFLFLGMMIMSDELKVLAEHPAFRALFSTFDCSPRNGWVPVMPLLGAIGIGLVTTLIIQSSSACTGIIIALGAGGLIDLYTAVALVLGSNVGTTVTAQLAALTANRVAKQAALAHTLFNIIGVLVIASTFWFRWGSSDEPIFFHAVNWLSAGGDLPRRIANAHTIFNIFTTLLLVPFIPLLARICEKLIPKLTTKEKIQRLEPRLLDTPAIALVQTGSTLRVMFKKSWKMVDCALASMGEWTPEQKEFAKRLKERENRIDEYQHDITDYLAQLMRRPLSEKEADAIPILIHCTNDAERIGDHTEIILEQIDRYRGEGAKLSNQAVRELKQLHGLLSEQARCALELLVHCTPVALKRAEELELTINNLAGQFEANHMARLSQKECDPVSGMFFIEILSEISKVSRHIANISERCGILDQLIEG